MTKEEYNILFHKVGLNRVAFKAVNDCDEEILALVNEAIATEREACAQAAEAVVPRHTECGNKIAFAIRKRGAP